jgi:hypothetical protein
MTVKYKDFYYKYISIAYNKEDIDKFLIKWPLTESRFEKIDLIKAKELLPSLFDWFNKHDLEVTQIFLINHKPDFKQTIHVDYDNDSRPRLAINIPINPLAADSTTRVYEFINNHQVEIDYRDGQKVVYSKVNPEHVKKIGEYKSHCPVLLNITKPHSAWNNTDHIRGVITFRFEKDPDFLIKD